MKLRPAVIVASIASLMLITTALPTGSPALADDQPVTGPTSTQPSVPGETITTPGTPSGASGLTTTGGTLSAVPSSLSNAGQAAFYTVNSDGSGTLTYVHIPDPGTAVLPAGPTGYDPAPMLGAVVTSSTTSTAATGPSANAATSCSYGTGRGEIPNGCPPIHWERFTTTHSYWYVEDHTGSTWPVYAAQINWNKSCCVGAYYAGTSCSSSFHCVKATEGNFGPQGWDGLTHLAWDSNHHLTTVSIQYNDSYVETYNQHWTDTCQEQGHAMGLDHDTSSASCMYATGYNSHLPIADDYNELQYEIYNH